MNELPDAIRQIGILLETLVTDISKRQLATPSTSTFTGPFPVKPPIFYGRKNENVITWLFQMDQIFHNRPSSDESKLCFVVSCLADAALGWYHSICTTSASGIRFPISTWTQFASEITCAFQPPNQQQLLRAKLRTLTQSGSIHDYITSFRNVISQVTSMDEDDKIGYFTFGLRHATKNELTYRAPSTLEEAMNLAFTFDSSKFTASFDTRHHGRPFAKDRSNIGHETAPMELGSASAQL
jgi:hypothetical protein